MNKAAMWKGLIALQAICMIVLTVVVVVKIAPPGDNQEEPAATPDHAGSEAMEDSNIAAIIGERYITVKELKDALMEEYGEQMLNKLMVRQAIDLESETLGLEVTEQEIQEEFRDRAAGYGGETEYLKVMKEQLGMSKDEIRLDIRYQLLLEKISTRQVTITDEQVKDYIQAHPETFGPQVQLRIAWIVTSSEQLSRLVLDQLEGGAQFAVLAQRFSEDEYTADDGGELGLVDMQDPFIERAVLDTAGSLKVGGVAGPVAVKQGYAIIQLKERQQEMKLDEQRQMERARKQLALEEAVPLGEMQNILLHKYGATVYQS